MASRRRIGHCLYVTAAGSFQTWWRDQDERIVWATRPTLEAAIELRDKMRAERAELLKTPRRLRVAQRLGELLNAPPPDNRPEWVRKAMSYLEADCSPYDDGVPFE